jgi:hypothetical protein
MNITKDLAIQSTEYIKQFCEKLRLDPNVDLMKVMSYQDIASCYISLQRIETFVTQASDPVQSRSNPVEVETLQKLLHTSAEKIAKLQGVISGLHAKLQKSEKDQLEVEEEIHVIELHDVPTEEQSEKVPLPKRKQISQIVNI